MTDKIAAANKIDKVLKDSGALDLQAIAKELHEFGSYEAALGAAKRELADVQARATAAKEGLRAEYNKLDQRKAADLAELERAKADLEEQTTKAVKKAAQLTASADQAVADAKQRADDIMSAAEADANKTRADLEVELADKRKETERLTAEINELSAKLKERQSALDKINTIIGKHAGVANAEPVAA